MAVRSHLSARRSAGSRCTGTAPCPAERPPRRTSASPSASPGGSVPRAARRRGLAVHDRRRAPLEEDEEERKSYLKAGGKLWTRVHLKSTNGH